MLILSIPAGAASRSARPALLSCSAVSSVRVTEPEPPAWLLLAGAVALLGAGRLAARR